MKTIMLFVHPDKDFLPEHKIMIKIQIDSLLKLGWKKEDIILATNFPYKYRGVKSLLVSDNNFCDFCHTFTLVNVILELFDRKIIKDNELYWYHDEDAYQLLPITESELDLGNTDMALSYKGIKEKWDAGSIFFKKGAEDIFRNLREIVYKYKVNEEYALIALYTNNLLWITDKEFVARTKFVPLYTPSKKMDGRIKTLDLRYMFTLDGIEHYDLAEKPLKVIHFSFSDDLYLDSAMFGKNSFKKPLITKQLIEIFQKHGIVGTRPKKLKNLMIYFSPQKGFPANIEYLVKMHIDNMQRLGWKREDIILITNFSYEYRGVRTTQVDESLFCKIKDNAIKSNAVFHLLNQDIVKNNEIWLYQDIGCFQQRQIDGSEINFESKPAVFIEDNDKFDFSSFYFRKGSHKVFEWIRNTALRKNCDEADALKSLAGINYRNINSMFTKSPPLKIFANRLPSIMSYQNFS